ncbi:heme biosynthesis protein HemY [Rhizobium sp. FKL33]|uniref:heme biosynthesis protein HemY n=1 Tax=Rhizobium sp. FKL33 TaxID=2562307 RepID=UPI0010BFBB4F|nr:heme biosynthesis protein HemY [Rhizobium sp. FKL33]
MIRILVFIAVVLAVGYGFSWLADRPGDLFIIWQGQRIEMTLMTAAVLVSVLIASVMLVWWLIRAIWTSPHSVTRYFRARKRDRGYQALSTGLIAVGSGDAPLARRMLDRTKGLIRADSEPLIHLLEAQALLIEGKTEDARKKFEAMAEDPETRELGLRGLYLEAQRLGAHEAARHYAEKAVEKAPHLPWAAEATLEYRTQAGRFDDAIRLLETQRVLNGMDRKTHDRKKAVLLAGRALSRLDGDPKGAREDAVHALKLSPDLVAASLVAAKAYLREDNQRKAMGVLEQAWKLTPHAQVASAYVEAGGGSAADKLRRAQRLESMQSHAYESLYAVASAALGAREFALARAKAEAAARIDDRESAFLLMADIEEAETGDQGRVRHWLAQALRAPRDPEWVADGQASDVWLPLSPVTGKLDAFEWKSLHRARPGAIEDGNRAAEAFSRLPDRRDAATQTAEPAPAATPEPVGAAPVEPVVAPAASVAPAPAPAQTASRKAPPPAEEPVQPFFGRPPDDPGVKQPKAADGARLF